MSRHASSLRHGQPVWLDKARRAPPTRTYPAFRGRSTCDVVIVGGGMTGALVALEFARAGVPITLLESGRVGSGSTAASSALLLQEPDRGLAELAARYGRRASHRIWELGGHAVADVIAMLRGNRIACDLVERDAVYYAADECSLQRLRTEFVLRSGAGFPCEWLGAGDLRRVAGIAARGAIRTSGNAQFDPYKACLGLVRAAAVAGAAIHERSPVTRIRYARGRVRVHTRDGYIDASRVVIATGYATPQFRPLAGRFRMYRTYVLATRALTRTQRRDIGLGNLMIWDTNRPYHYARWTPDHRLLLGGADRPLRGGQPRSREFTAATRQLRADFESLLPALADIGIESAWEGLFALTPDSLPFVGPHRRYPGHLFALGYGGNGMTFGSLAAHMLLEHWRGERSPDHRLFHFSRFR
jgi:glycine/D-amino acid oxidase-like deaminating enzyme